MGEAKKRAKQATVKLLTIIHRKSLMDNLG
jgi:hypothetical protein